MPATRYLLIGGLGVTVAAAIAALPPADEPRAHGDRPANAPRPAASARVQAPRPATSDTAAPPADEAAPQGPRERFARTLSGHAEPVPPHRVVEMIERGLASTGESSEPWTRDADRAFAGLRTELQSVVHGERLRITSPRCFAAGCMVTIEYPPDADVVSLAQSLMNAQAIVDWPGGKLVSPTAPGTGGAQTHRWVLIRPDHL